MSLNSTYMIHQLREDFEKLLTLVTGPEAHTATLDRMERSLFRQVLRLGFKLLHLFILTRVEAESHAPQPGVGRTRVPYHSQKPTGYFSIFGKLTFERAYFYTPGQPGLFPLDRALSLPERCYSNLLMESAEVLAVDHAYDKGVAVLSRLLGVTLSESALETKVVEDSQGVKAFYRQKDKFPVKEEGPILVAQADGKGVPMVLAEPTEPQPRLGKGQKRGRKQEAMVTSVYTIAAHIRTPQAVVDSFFQQNSTATASQEKAIPYHPQHKHIWATLDGKDAALERLAQQVARRKGAPILDRVALCDGYEPLQTRMTNQFPDFTLILDFIHADEYLWDVVNALLGEQNPQRLEWMADYTLKILSGQTESVIATFQQMAQDKQYTAKQRTQLEKTATYFQRNLPYMDYNTYLKRGWPIASGVIEGACRHFVKDRCELSGMRWTQTGVENLLRLRAVAENGDWDEYHQFRKRQRYARLYNQPYPEQLALELQAMDHNSLLEKRPGPSTKQVVEPITPDNQAPYHRLPLAA